MTTSNPPADAARATRPNDEGRRGRRGTFLLLGVAVLLAGLIALLVVVDDGGDVNVPEDVQALLDDFIVAIEDSDDAALRELVTDDFRRPVYTGERFGGVTYRSVVAIDDVAAGRPLEIERVGDPLVSGEGPWYVSQVETWTIPVANDHGDDLEVRYEAISTYVVVADADGGLRVDDAYWAGHEVS